jgi:DNA-binding NarL/FixJ family response regulator
MGFANIWPLSALPVLKGNIYLSKEMSSSFLKSVITGGNRTVRRRIERLSDRELQILDLIGRGRSTRDIAASLGSAHELGRFLLDSDS